jgi:hypothetical protein
VSLGSASLWNRLAKVACRPRLRPLPEPRKLSSRLAAHFSDVRFWHKADMLNALTNVRFWGQSGH